MRSRANATAVALPLGLLALVAGVASGCRAQASPPGMSHDLGPDLSMPPDLARTYDFAVPPPQDLLTVPDLDCPPGPVEICGNGCDDDRNGYADDDDPHCTAQVLVTTAAGSSELDRLILSGGVTTRFLDGNPVNGGANAMYSAAFSPGLAWLVYDAATEELLSLVLPPQQSMGTGVEAPVSPSPTYSTRDVCAFAGQLIVVEVNGKLHVFNAQGQEVSAVTVAGSFTAGGTVFLTACASDGQQLYVATHDYSIPSGPTKFLVYGPTLTPSPSPLAMPPSLVTAGYDRCLDFAWTSRGFYGLFVKSGGQIKDYMLNATQITPFAFDGGVGPPIDAGTIHGLGEFSP